MPSLHFLFLPASGFPASYVPLLQTHTFVLSPSKSTQWDQIVHSCLSYSDTGEVACQSGPVLSGAVRWTWDKSILNINLAAPLFLTRREKSEQLARGWRADHSYVFIFPLNARSVFVQFYWSLNGGLPKKPPRARTAPAVKEHGATRWAASLHV